MYRTQVATFTPADQAIFFRMLEEKVQGDVLPRLQRFADVKPVGITRVIDRPVYINSQPTDWLILPSTQDPLVQSKRFPIPLEKAQMLHAIAREHNFQKVLLAHEITKEQGKLVNPDKPIPIKVVTPPPSVDWQRIRESLPSAKTMARYTGGALLAGALVAAVIIIPTVVIGMAVGMVAAAALDPVVFGCVGLHEGPLAPGEPCYVIQLARWYE